MPDATSATHPSRYEESREAEFDAFLDSMLERAEKLHTVDDLMALIRDGAAILRAHHRDEMARKAERAARYAERQGTR